MKNQKIVVKDAQNNIVSITKLDPGYTASLITDAEPARKSAKKTKPVARYDRCIAGFAAEFSDLKIPRIAAVTLYQLFDCYLDRKHIKLPFETQFYFSLHAIKQLDKFGYIKKRGSWDDNSQKALLAALDRRLPLARELASLDRGTSRGVRCFELIK